MMWLLVLLVGIFSLLYLLYNRVFIDDEFEKIPGPKGILFFGNTFDIIMEADALFNYFRNLSETYKDLFKIKIGEMKYLSIFNPEDVETMLTNTKYNKKGYFYFTLRPWLNDGLLLSSGEKWYERRKILTPAFHFNILRHFSTILIENTEKFIESLESEVDKQKTDIYPFIANMTLNSICETAMGTQLDEEISGMGKRYKDAIHTLGTYFVYRGQRVWFHIDFLFNLSSVGRKQKDLLNLIGRFRDRVIKKRRNNDNYRNLYAELNNDPKQDIYSNKKKRLAMLDLLLAIEEQGKIDTMGINEEVDTFMFETMLTNTKYNKKGYFYFTLRPWLNDGLLLSSGEKWYERRKILTPAFHFNILRHFSTILIENTEKFIESLESEVDKQKTDIYPFIANMTLNSICETAMGTQLDEEISGMGKRYKDAIHTLGTYFVYRGQRVWFHIDFLFNLSSVGRKQKDLLNLIGRFRDRVIKKRRNNDNYRNLYAELNNDPKQDIYSNKKKRLAMLDLLLAIEEQGKIDTMGINEEVDTFMFEGHDTSSTALLFTLMLLANHPEEQNKAFEECYQIFGTSKRTATMSDLGKMKYLESCIKESLRLYPPVCVISRACDDSLNLKNYKCPPGTDCAIFIFDLHRRSDQFVEPLRFRPERFMEAPTWHPFAYIPFSAGPRNCIGQRFAMMQMKIVLSAVLRKYRLLPVTKPQDISFVVDIILRSKNPIYVKFEKR